MEERCKHDLLPGHCGFCLAASPAPAGHGNGHDPVHRLGTFAQPSEPALSKRRTGHESPEPGASVDSEAIGHLPWAAMNVPARRHRDWNYSPRAGSSLVPKV
jgi:hypothetical protein